MAFTDNCDLYVGIHEEGVNRVAQHIMLQRPSLFNYATPDVAGNRELWCAAPRFTSDVTHYGNPLFTVLPYLPVLGADSPPVGLGFCVQLARTQVDFHPSNIFGLPPELGPELAEQQLAIELKICGGICCPDPAVLDRIPVTSRAAGVTTSPDLASATYSRVPPRRETPPQVPVPGRTECFCLDVVATAHVAREFINGQERVVCKVDGVEIVDVSPDGLESNMECYIRTTLTLLLRQKLSIPLSVLFFDFELFGTSVSLTPTPNPPVAHNPAIEEDQLKAFVTMAP